MRRVRAALCAATLAHMLTTFAAHHFSRRFLSAAAWLSNLEYALRPFEESDVDSRDLYC